MSYDAGASDYEYFGMSGTSTTSTVAGLNSAGDTQIRFTANGVSPNADNSLNAEITLFNLAGTRGFTCDYKISNHNVSSLVAHETGSGWRVATTDVDAIRFLMSSGDISSGTFTLYGLAGA